MTPLAVLKEVQEVLAVRDGMPSRWALLVAITAAAGDSPLLITQTRELIQAMMGTDDDLSVYTADVDKDYGTIEQLFIEMHELLETAIAAEEAEGPYHG